jgi:hypothetical protein
MGRVCSTYGKEEGAYRVLVGKPERKRPLGRAGIDGRIILRLIFWKFGGGWACTGKMAEDRDRWRALVNVVMNLQFP